MPAYIAVLRHHETEESLLLRFHADSLQAATNYIVKNVPNSLDWNLEKLKLAHGGARPGAGRPSKWGPDVDTDRFRLPVKFGQNAVEIINALEATKTILDVYEERVYTSALRSGGQPAERYKYVAQLCKDLRSQLEGLPDSWG